jgi:hypothetical protein
MCPHLPLQTGDLLVESGDDRDQGPHGSGVGGGQGGRAAQLRAAQRGQDSVGPVRDLVTAGSLEDRRYLGAGQLRGARRVSSLAQQCQGVGGIQVIKRGHRGRKVLQQLRPQPQQHRGTLPDQRLVRAGQHLNRLRRRAVSCRRAQLMRIGAHHIGQHVRVTAVALRPGHAMPAPIPRRLQRVHANTTYPAATSAVTHGPWSVSIPTCTSAAPSAGTN